MEDSHKPSGITLNAAFRHQPNKGRDQSGAGRTRETEQGQAAQSQQARQDQQAGHHARGLAGLGWGHIVTVLGLEAVAQCCGRGTMGG